MKCECGVWSRKAKNLRHRCECTKHPDKKQKGLVKKIFQQLWGWNGI